MVELVGETVWETVEQGLKFKSRAGTTYSDKQKNKIHAGMVELVDTRDLNSLALKSVRVQVPLPAQCKDTHKGCFYIGTGAGAGFSSENPLHDLKPLPGIFAENTDNGY